MATVQMRGREAVSLQAAMPSPRTGLESTGIRIIQPHLNVKVQPGPKSHLGGKFWARRGTRGQDPHCPGASRPLPSIPAQRGWGPSFSAQCPSDEQCRCRGEINGVQC